MDISASLPGVPWLWRGPGGRWQIDEQVPSCPLCTRAMVRSGQRMESLCDLPSGSHPTTLEIPVQRWRCRTPGCLGTDVDPLSGLRAQLPGRQRRSNLTQRLYDELIDRYQRGTTVQELSQWSGIQPRTLWRLLEEHREQTLTASRSLGHWRNLTHVGIDEIYWRDRVLGVIVCLNTRELLDLLPDRSISTVVESLQEIRQIVETLTGEPWRPVVVTDMWSDYRTAVEQVFQGNAVHVTDRFHLQAKIGDDLIDLARKILPITQQRPRQLRAVREEFHRSCRNTLQTTPGIPKLSEEQRGQLRLALDLATELHRVWESSDPQSARQAYAAWRWHVARVAEKLPGTRPYRRLIYLFETWNSEIFAYFDTVSCLPNGKRVTGALTESVNARLRQIERQGHRHTRDHFGSTSEQRHFEALWSAAMHTINRPALQGSTLWGIYRPELPHCPCGSPVTAQHWRDTRRVIRDVPLGERPVAYRVQDGVWQCPACRRTGTASLPPTPQMTVALMEYVQEQRLGGWSLRRLERATGLSRTAIARMVGQIKDHSPFMAAPAVLGIQIWRWRRKMFWILTDAREGTLVDILPVTETTLTVWLSSAQADTVQVCLLALPDWRSLIPVGKTLAIDRYTAVLPVQRALRDVQRRYTDTLSVAARRQPVWKGHRRIILSAPHQQNKVDLERLATWTQGCRELGTARQLRDEYLRCLDMGAADCLTIWIQGASQAMAVIPDTPLGRTVKHAFEDACTIVERSAPMIMAAAQLGDVNLGLSRVLLRHLREHPATRQPDFEVMRRAALHALGVKA